MERIQDSVIRCENLSKCYQIYSNPKARLKQALWRGRRQYFREFWALRDVTLEVKKGESLGIIGRNGSGKSTLLQLICGTVTPTEGTIKTKGRIAALLELGSGFNPEFTGIENVYLNAALLGLSNNEIKQSIASIIDFSEVEDFIYQPVKTYSSGMMLRLAFSVIAYSCPEILIIDEALAVGDTAFQQKCIRKVNELQEEGATILLVSHDENQIKKFCSKSIYLEHGRTVLTGSTKECLEYYLKDLRESPRNNARTANLLNQDYANIDYRAEYIKELTAESSCLIVKGRELKRDLGDGSATIIHLDYTDQDGNSDGVDRLVAEERVVLRLRVKADSQVDFPAIGYMIKDKNGIVVFSIETESFLASKLSLPRFTAGTTYQVLLSFRFPILSSGTYSVDIAIADGKGHDHTLCFWCYDSHILQFDTPTLCNGLTGSDSLTISVKDCR